MISPRIWVACILKQNSNILIGKRKSKHWEGVYGFPGGNLEMGESIVDCAFRECKEETWIVCLSGEIVWFTEDIFSEENHYITFFVLVESFDWIPETLEEEKCEWWEWYRGNALPNPLFLPIINLLKKNPHIFD
jgi:8-oxo-dGTP diphosphatase